MVGGKFVAAALVCLATSAAYADEEGDVSIARENFMKSYIELRYLSDLAEAGRDVTRESAFQYAELRRQATEQLLAFRKHAAKRQDADPYSPLRNELLTRLEAASKLPNQETLLSVLKKHVHPILKLIQAISDQIPPPAERNWEEWVEDREHVHGPKSWRKIRLTSVREAHDFLVYAAFKLREVLKASPTPSALELAEVGKALYQAADSIGENRLQLQANAEDREAGQIVQKLTGSDGLLPIHPLATLRWIEEGALPRIKTRVDQLTRQIRQTGGEKGFNEEEVRAIGRDALALRETDIPRLRELFRRMRKAESFDKILQFNFGDVWARTLGRSVDLSGKSGIPVPMGWAENSELRRDVHEAVQLYHSLQDLYAAQLFVSSRKIRIEGVNKGLQEIEPRIRFHKQTKVADRLERLIPYWSTSSRRSIEPTRLIRVTRAALQQIPEDLAGKTKILTETITQTKSDLDFLMSFHESDLTHWPKLLSDPIPATLDEADQAAKKYANHYTDRMVEIGKELKEALDRLDYFADEVRKSRGKLRDYRQPEDPWKLEEKNAKLARIDELVKKALAAKAARPPEEPEPPLPPPTERYNPGELQSLFPNGVVPRPRRRRHFDAVRKPSRGSALFHLPKDTQLKLRSVRGETLRLDDWRQKLVRAWGYLTLSNLDSAAAAKQEERVRESLEGILSWGKKIPAPPKDPKERGLPEIDKDLETASTAPKADREIELFLEKRSWVVQELREKRDELLPENIRDLVHELWSAQKGLLLIAREREAAQPSLQVVEEKVGESGARIVVRTSKGKTYTFANYGDLIRSRRHAVGAVRDKRARARELKSDLDALVGEFLPPVQRTINRRKKDPEADLSQTRRKRFEKGVKRVLDAISPQAEMENYVGAEKYLTQSLGLLRGTPRNYVAVIEFLQDARDELDELIQVFDQEEKGLKNQKEAFQEIWDALLIAGGAARKGARELPGLISGQRFDEIEHAVFQLRVNMGNVLSLETPPQLWEKDGVLKAFERAASRKSLLTQMIGSVDDRMEKAQAIQKEFGAFVRKAKASSIPEVQAAADRWKSFGTKAFRFSEALQETTAAVKKIEELSPGLRAPEKLRTNLTDLEQTRPGFVADLTKEFGQTKEIPRSLDEIRRTLSERKDEAERNLAKSAEKVRGVLPLLAEHARKTRTLRGTANRSESSGKVLSTVDFMGLQTAYETLPSIDLVNTLAKARAYTSARAEAFAKSYGPMVGAQALSAAFWGWRDRDFSSLDRALEDVFVPERLAEFAAIAAVQRRGAALGNALPKNAVLTRYAVEHGLMMGVAMWLGGFVYNGLQTHSFDKTWEIQTSREVVEAAALSTVTFPLARASVALLSRLRGASLLARLAGGSGFLPAWAISLGTEAVVFAGAEGYRRLLQPALDKGIAVRKLYEALQHVDVEVASHSPWTQGLEGALAKLHGAMSEYERSVVLRGYLPDAQKSSAERMDLVDGSLFAEAFLKDQALREKAARPLGELAAEEREAVRLGYSRLAVLEARWDQLTRGGPLSAAQSCLPRDATAYDFGAFVRCSNAHDLEGHDRVWAERLAPSFDKAMGYDEEEMDRSAAKYIRAFEENRFPLPQTMHESKLFYRLQLERLLRSAIERFGLAEEEKAGAGNYAMLKRLAEEKDRVNAMAYGEFRGFLEQQEM